MAAAAGNRVLIIDDDIGTCDTFSHALRRLDFVVTLAQSGRDALRLSASHAFDLAVVDLLLGDMLGTDVVRRWRAEGTQLPFILVSGFATTVEVVEAMRLGALEVVDKPLDIDRLETLVSSALKASRGSRFPTDRSRTLAPGPPRSAANRWASFILRACQSDSDPKTSYAIAREAAVSLRVFTERCAMLKIRPRDARDLARVMRALMQTRWKHDDVAARLDVGDRRTLNFLLGRAGIADVPTGVTLSPNEFLERQRFVDQNNEGLKALRILLTRHESAL